MPTAWVIHAASDRDFVRSRLLADLPTLGFTAWIDDLEPDLERHCALVVVSASACRSEFVRRDVEQVLARGPSPIPILVDDTPPAAISPMLAHRVAVDYREPGRYAYQALARAMPAMQPDDPRSPLVPPGARPLGWNEELFSDALAAALARQDHSAAARLTDTFERYATRLSYAYGEREAFADLAALKRYRKFGLMRRLGAAIVGTGTRGRGTVLKLYAQALIEQGEFDTALGVLDDMQHDPEVVLHEINEAKGLTGRIFKQRYVNRPDAADAAQHIGRAIQAYGDVYAEDPTQVWHGVNTASCILRAARDGIADVAVARAWSIAEEILEYLAEQESSGDGGLPLWDRATRVESLLVLGRYVEADLALDAYLCAYTEGDSSAPYPFFELAATQRQFVEVLQLEQDPRGRPLVRKLGAEVDRYRSGTVLASGVAASREQAPFWGAAMPAAPRRLHLLLRVGDPAWRPGEHVPDFEITARLGTILSATGTQVTVQALLRDLDVISVEESYPAGTDECHDSVPFIRVPAAWQVAGVNAGAGALIAIVDGGIDVLHQAFLDGGGESRIVEIWDQQDDTGPPPPGYKDGTHHTAADIARYVAEQKVPVKLGRDAHGHGTHVASIAAGRPGRPDRVVAPAGSRR